MNCPDADELWALCSGELDRGRVARLLQHAATCDACREALEATRLAVEGAGEAEGAGEDAGSSLPGPAVDHAAGSEEALPGTSTGVPRPRRPAWLLPAAAVIVIGLGVALFNTLDDTPETTRRGDDPEVIWVDLGEGRALPRDAFELRWQPVPDAASYVVELLSPDLDLLERSTRLETHVHRVAPPSLSAIDDGGVVLWRVEARLATGDLSRSPVFRTRIAP